MQAPPNNARQGFIQQLLHRRIKPCLQYAAFHNVIDGLLPCDTWPFATQKATYHNTPEIQTAAPQPELACHNKKKDMQKRCDIEKNP